MIKTYFRAKRESKVLPKAGSYILPNKLRKELKKIWGIPVFGNKKEVKKKFKEFVQKKKFKKIITVGDYCSLILSSEIKIFDGKIKRRRVKIPFKWRNSDINCANPSGTIQSKAWVIIKKAIKENRNVFVNGEEDLLVIPAVLLSEEKWLVVYGLPEKGVCLIEVSPKIKKELKELLKKFSLKGTN